MFCLMNRFLKSFLNQNSLKSKCFSSIVNSDFEGIYDTDKQFEELSVDSFKTLITDPQIKDKVELILSEYEYEKYTSLRVPTTLTIDQMKDLLTLEDPTDRRYWISYLYKRQNAKINGLKKRKEHSEEYWTQKKEIYSKSNANRTGIWNNDNELTYGLWHNTIFSKISATSVKRYHSHRLRTAAHFNPKLVIDLDFDQYMKLSESRLLVQQIHLLYNYNRYRTVQPFDLWFTNCDPSSASMKAIPKMLPKYNLPEFMASFERKSYLDLFPKEKLVYLSPNARETLKKVTNDDIVIIGGIIDKSYHEPITFIKAQKEGIRTARLPIDEHVLWGSGSKYLCLNHVVAILHDVSVGVEWRKALTDNIPQRKQKSVEEVEYEDKLRRQKYVRHQKNLKYTKS